MKILEKEKEGYKSTKPKKKQVTFKGGKRKGRTQNKRKKKKKTRKKTKLSKVKNK